MDRMIKDLIRSTGDSWKGIGKNGREKEKKDWKELMKKRRKKQNLKKEGQRSGMKKTKWESYIISYKKFWDKNS